jgi:hypothetical protein
MTRATGGRIRSLEREVRRLAGCPACRGRELVTVAEAEPWPAWLDERARCRACGRGVKLVDRASLDAL